MDVDGSRDAWRIRGTIETDEDHREVRPDPGPRLQSDKPPLQHPGYGALSSGQRVPSRQRKRGMDNEILGTADADLLMTVTVPARLSRASVLLFRATILAIEAGWVLESGTLLHAWHSLEPAVAVPAAMAAVYLGATLLTHASFELPRRQAQTSPFRTLGAIFLVATVLSAPSSLGALPSALLWFGLALGGIEGLRHAAVHLANRLPVLMARPRPVAFIGNSESAARIRPAIRAVAEQPPRA
jgi:hypothetical protein